MPDLRGLFLRGYGSQAHAQDNGSTVGVTTTLHSSGQLGQVQGDVARELVGNFGSIRSQYLTTSGIFEVGPSFISYNGFNEVPGSMVTFKSSRITAVGPENRPVNMATRFLIRARP